jgi:hypothetical protein
MTTITTAMMINHSFRFFHHMCLFSATAVFLNVVASPSNNAVFSTSSSILSPRSAGKAARRSQGADLEVGKEIPAIEPRSLSMF